MKKQGMNAAVLAAVFCAALFSGGAAFAADGEAKAAVSSNAAAVSQPERFDIKDVFGKVIPGKDLDGWIIGYAFGNEKNADTAIGWLKKVGLAHPDADGVIYIIVADASTYSRVLQPVVKKIMKREYKKNMQGIKKEMVEKNIKFKYELEERFILVADTKGEIFERFGIADKKDIPHLIVVDGTHKARADFTEYSDEVPAMIGKLMDERDQAKKYAYKTSQRKKNMLPRYAALGGLLWLLLK